MAGRGREMTISGNNYDFYVLTLFKEGIQDNCVLRPYLAYEVKITDDRIYKKPVILKTKYGLYNNNNSLIIALEPNVAKREDALLKWAGDAQEWNDLDTEWKLSFIL